MTDTIHLIGIGPHQAKRASDLKVGDTVVYNYGITSTIVSLTRPGNMVKVQVKAKDGQVYDRRYRSTTLVGYSNP